MISDSDLTTGDDPQDDPHGDAEWAWFADAYRRVPEPRPEAIAQAAHAMQASVATWHLVRVALRWLLGTVTGVGIAIGGYAVVKSGYFGRTASSNRAAVRGGPAMQGQEQAPTPSQPVDTLTTVPPPALTPSQEPIPAPTPMPLSKPASPSEEPGDTAMPPDTAQAPDTADALIQSLMLFGLREVSALRLRAALGDSATQALYVMLHDAGDSGLPYSSLLERAMSGIAENASSSEIMDQVAHRLETLRDAHTAFGDVSPNQLALGAFVIEGGAQASQLADLWRQITSQGRDNTGLHTLAGLVSSDVPGADAAAAIARAFDAGVPDDALENLAPRVAGAIASGVSPLDALRMQLDSIITATTFGPSPAVPGPKPDSSSPSPSPAPTPAP